MTVSLLPSALPPLWLFLLFASLPPLLLFQIPLSFTPTDTKHHQNSKNNKYSFLVYFLWKGLGQHHTCLSRLQFKLECEWKIFFFFVAQVFNFQCPCIALALDLVIPMLNTFLRAFKSSGLGYASIHYLLDLSFAIEDWSLVDVHKEYKEI